MNKDERKHIDKVGLQRFDDAASRAMMRLKMDGKLRAATKLREALSYEMALKATGFPPRPFSLASKQNENKFGEPDQEMQDIIDGYLNSTEVEETVS